MKRRRKSQIQRNRGYVVDKIENEFNEMSKTIDKCRERVMPEFSTRLRQL